MWSVYILRCGDLSLYTGITNNLAVRVATHNAGKGGAYTRSHLPVTLVYVERHRTKSRALKREAEIKSWSRTTKLRHVALQKNHLAKAR